MAVGVGFPNNMYFLPMLVAVVLFSFLSQGVDAKNCHHCDWQTEAQCVNETTTCADTVCLVAKALIDGKEVYKKTCRSAEDCNNIVALCGRPDPKRTCLAAACCDGELCVPAQLRSIALPSSSVKTSSVEVQTSNSTEIIMTSSDIFATAAVASSKEKTPVTETTTMAMATTTTTTTTMATTTTSFKEIITKATEASMKGMMGTPTTKYNMMISKALVHSKAPGIGTTTRPTCKDSSGMRHVLSPLAMVFVAARLMALQWMQF